MPFNVDIAEQLKTQIAKLQRNTSDGSARHALGLVRQALDETPLMPAPAVNPGNLPAVPGTVPPSPATLGQQSIDAFNQARQAARERFAWHESSPAISRALGGANADTFIQQNILSKAAGFDHVANLAQVVNQNPSAREACLIRGWQPWTQSTGPKSPEGKARASQNSFKHGGRTAKAIELHRELSELLRDFKSPLEELPC